jgi:D-alanyl-D-alanine carboxypeptidase
VTVFSRYPDDKLTIAVLSNFVGAPVGRIEGELAALYLSSAAAPPAELSLSEDMLQRYVGAYKVTPALIIKVTRDGNHLYAQASAPASRQQRFELFANAERDFFYKVSDAKISFVADEKGLRASCCIRTVEINKRHVLLMQRPSSLNRH